MWVQILSHQQYRDIVQWLEHFSDTEGVIGSSPIVPTYSDVFQWQKAALIRQ